MLGFACGTDDLIGTIYCLDLLFIRTFCKVAMINRAAQIAKSV
jgi:hypothetical protein